MSDVANTVNQSAAGTQNIAEKTVGIVNKVNDVQKQMQISSKDVQKLNQAIGKFKL